MSPTMLITLLVIDTILFIVSTVVRIYLAIKAKKSSRPNKWWANDLLWFCLMLVFAFIGSMLYGTMPWLEGATSVW